MRITKYATALACVLLPALAHSAIQIDLLNSDPPGIGFNDTTPVAPVGGNAGLTRGEQRLIAFQFAADLWGAILSGTETISIDASFAPLFCTSSSAVLGQAGPMTIHADFSGGMASTWYPAALANELNGSDLDRFNPEIQASFNGDLDDNNSCLNNRSWYYGLDNDAAGNEIDFLNTVMHEIAHGLGFAGFTDLATGSEAGPPFKPDVFARLTFDVETGLAWDEMSNLERSNSAVNSGEVVWTGAATVQRASALLDDGLHTGTGQLLLYAPAPLQLGSSIYHWDTSAAPNLLMEPMLQGDLRAATDVELTATQLADIGWTLADVDGDQVPDVADNCILVANTDQRDTDGDHYGNICDADLDNNGDINFLDLGLMKEVFFEEDENADLDGDGSVNFLDLGVMKESFFGGPGPSGTAG